MKKISLVLLSFLILLAVTALALKPSEERCKKEGAAVVEAHLKSKINSQFRLINSLLEKMAQKTVSVEDKIIYKDVKYKLLPAIMERS